MNELELLLTKEQLAAGGRYMPGSYVQFDAPDLKGALALAERLKEQGVYRFFRGQRDAEWHLTSSFARLDEEGRRNANGEFTEFRSFVLQSEELLPYLQDDDAIIATAQHHGLFGTTFIDFTQSPEIAAWFAAEGGEPGRFGCIYLVDPEETAEMFDFLTKRGSAVRFFEIDVRNLWRLQAQQGLFLEACLDVAGWWPFDRIIFPHGEEEIPIDRRHIYPDRQSHLEQAIGQFALQRSRRLNHERFLTDLKANGVPYLEMVGDDSLTLKALEPQDVWQDGPNERWQDIDIDTDGPDLEIDSLEIPECVEPLVTTRRHSTDLLTLTGGDESDRKKLQAMVERAWNGARPHPYSNRQLTSMIVGLACTYRGLKGFNLFLGSEQENAASNLLGECLEIEFMGSGQTAGRAFVGVERLWACLTEETKVRRGLLEPSRKGLYGLLLEEYGHVSQNFVPAALCELFVDQVIPWQIATGRNPVTFSPFHVLTLGLP